MKYREIPFAKYHARGNDFIVAEGGGLPRPVANLARSLLDRHTGAGADGLVAVLAARSRSHDARVRFFNADGSEAEMSGNGIRCAGAFLLEARPSRRGLEIETSGGVKSLELVGGANRKWVFRVGMGQPILDPASIPFKGRVRTPSIVGFPLKIERRQIPVTVTSMGNPHCTIFVDGFSAFDWRRVGREVERHAFFPNRTNVEFTKVNSRHEIEVRYWERGVGETLSSGTGSCAAVVACVLNGLTQRCVRVRTLAGNLKVQWPENGQVLLTGPVERIARGIYYYRS